MHNILVLVAYAQMPLINAHTNISSEARGLNFDLILILSNFEFDHVHPYLGLNARKPVNNKAADQHAHPHSLISAFVIHLLDSIISKLAPSDISLF